MRNRIYWTSGIVILLSLVLVIVGFSIDEDWARAFNLTYWAEAIALIAFGVSWLTHGRAFYALRFMMDDADKNAAAKEEAA